MQIISLEFRLKSTRYLSFHTAWLPIYLRYLLSHLRSWHSPLSDCSVANVEVELLAVVSGPSCVSLLLA